MVKEVKEIVNKKEGIINITLSMNVPLFSVVQIVEKCHNNAKQHLDNEISFEETNSQRLMSYKKCR